MQNYKKIEKILIEKLGCEISECYVHFIIFYYKDIRFKCICHDDRCDVTPSDKGNKKYIIAGLIEMIIKTELTNKELT